MLVDDSFDETCLDEYRNRAITRINAMYLVVVSSAISPAATALSKTT